MFLPLLGKMWTLTQWNFLLNETYATEVVTTDRIILHIFAQLQLKSTISDSLLGCLSLKCSLLVAKGYIQCPNREWAGGQQCSPLLLALQQAGTSTMGTILCPKFHELSTHMFSFVSLESQADLISFTGVNYCYLVKIVKCTCRLSHIVCVIVCIWYRKL